MISLVERIRTVMLQYNAYQQVKIVASVYALAGRKV
jgi:hypothetical protein